MHLDAEGKQKNCTEALIMAIIHVALWNMEKWETRNLERKCFHRINVNTPFPDMWEGGGKKLLLNDVLHFFPSVIT